MENKKKKHYKKERNQNLTSSKRNHFCDERIRKKQLVVK